MKAQGAMVRTRVIVVLAIAAALAAGMAVNSSKLQKKAHQEYLTRTMSNFFTSLNPVVALDPVYTDADGDLLADSPVNSGLLARPDELVFSFIASDDSTNEAAQWQELLDAVAEATGAKVTYLRVTDTREQLEALRNGRLHISALGTGEVPAAVNTAGFVPVCTFGKEDGTSGYTMDFLVKASSNIEKLEDLQGKRIAFTRPRSNSGCKAAAMLLLEEKNLQPERDYKWSYTYGHLGSIEAVSSGEVDTAPIASDVFARMVAKGELQVDDFRTIYRSEQFPPAAFGFAYNLAPKLQEQIRQALLDFKWEGTKIAAEFGAEGTNRFIPVIYKDDWALVRRIDLAASKARQDLTR